MGTFALIALAAWCMALSVSDIRHRRLPDLLTGPGAAVVLGYAAGTGRLAAALVGAVLLSVPYLVVHLVTPAAFGAGDVKLAVGLGAAAGMCGGQAWVAAAVGAPVLTAVAGAAVLVVPRGGRSRCSAATDPPHRPRTMRRPRAPATPSTTGPVTLPHGPSMCVATLLAVGFG
ncbi:A24 family peptidase [Nocardia cyriacigeorgica]|uniref:prepilin peptidase n=1 Tax=Nocardia cyriacigeorgica TaxID=135487 RepID=UPI001893A95C|nr:A24 family peptidase [Nocardia cyriacigeorgica]MBF6435810.1 prepilin peptidase [Nocardia cyriacigeorgica]MBF6454111.1 prepilin peptidase [Nocardia cyriacigeorgica]MBF6482295.1 prepilin peptidase [Nocardia cyriacigeorgica]MBF6552005.1 prepilin peptidase [Nocardia cyriacigeorgica]